MVFFLMVFALAVYFEGLRRTKLLPIFSVLGIMMAVLLVFLTPHLPYYFNEPWPFCHWRLPQRRSGPPKTLGLAYRDVEGALPQVPQHLLLGKGFALSANDFQLLAGPDAAIRATFTENQIYALSGGYHNGPLSVILTFGIWGGIAIVWFWAAGVWVLYRNYRYGDPALRTVNTFLLVAFSARIIFFIFIFGDVVSETQYLLWMAGFGRRLEWRSMPSRAGAGHRPPTNFKPLTTFAPICNHFSTSQNPGLMVLQHRRP